jgi:hypothetical protein
MIGGDVAYSKAAAARVTLPPKHRPHRATLVSYNRGCSMYQVTMS